MDKHGFHILADFVHTTAYNTSDPFARYTITWRFLLDPTPQPVCRFWLVFMCLLAAH